jgi:hypothetical protein
MVIGFVQMNDWKLGLIVIMPVSILMFSLFLYKVIRNIVCKDDKY